ncbi:MAG: diguanylate cyclase [Dehalococcoidia bacterium]
MTWSPLALVPLTSALLYLALMRWVSRRSAHTSGSEAFLVFLGFMAVNSTASLTWRLTQETSASEYLLRVLELPLMGVTAAFLYLMQALYPTRWSARVRRYSYFAFGVIAVATLSGSVNRVTVDAVSNPAVWNIVAFSMAMAAISIGSLASVAYVVMTYRAHRDPFERNRLKYIALGSIIIFLGGMTNMVDALQKLPVDQGANAVAASVIAFAVLRYRLFNIDVAIRRGVARLLIGLPTSVGYVSMLFLTLSRLDIELLSVPGATVAIGYGFLVAFVAGYVRAGAEYLVDRMFVGGHIDPRAVIADLTRRTSEMRGVDDLIADIAEQCQLALTSSFVAILLLEEDRGEFVLAELTGPFPRTQPEWTISASNSVLARLAERAEPTTPYALARVVAGNEFPAHDVAEFGPYNDCVTAPILAQGKLLGVMFIAPKVYDAPFTLDDIDFLNLVSGQAALSIQNARLFEQLREAAETDFVTGLPNHRHLQDLFQVALSGAEVNGTPLSVAMVDVDNFKLFNDVHGHQVGDEALRRLSQVMRGAARPQDIVARYGGDEFLLLLPGLTRDEASEMMNRLGRQVRKTNVAASDSEASAAEQLPARISWGVATFPEDGRTRRSLTSVADSRLMQQKIEARRSATVHTGSAEHARLLEQDPEKLRVARALLDILDAKDPYTSEHSQQIASFALLMADEAGMPDRQRYLLWLGSLLHDVGKVGVSSEILRKPGRLSPEEWDQMRVHPTLGEQMVRGLLDVKEVIDIVGCHHERFDGSGYPRGLTGEDIPEMARMVTVADAFSAMVHDRPYRKGLAWPEAIEELRRHAGTQFDPEMVELFVRAVGHGEREAAA